MASLGTAYVDIRGDFSTLNRQLGGTLGVFRRSLGQMEAQAKTSFARIGGSASTIGSAVQKQAGTTNGALATVRTQATQTAGALSGIRSGASSAAGALGTVNSQAQGLGGTLGSVGAETTTAGEALSGLGSEASGLGGSFGDVESQATSAGQSLTDLGSGASGATDGLSSIDNQSQSTQDSLSQLDTKAFESAQAISDVGAKSNTTSADMAKMQARTTQAAQAAERSSRIQATFGRTFQQTGASVRRMAGGLLVAVSAYRAYSAAKNAISTTADLAKTTLTLHRNTGLSIASSSRWAAVMQARGASANTLSTAFTSLSKNVVKSADAIRTAEDATKALGQLPAGASDKAREGLLKTTQKTSAAADKQNAAFKKLGLTQQDIKDGTRDFDGLLSKVAEGFGKLRGGVDRAALAQTIFGKGGKELLPVFAQGNKSMQQQLALADKYHVTFGGKSVKSVHDLISAEKELKFAQLGIQTQFTQLVAPALTKGLKSVADFGREVSGVMNRRDLTGEEKWNRIGDLISGKISEATPKIAEAAGRIAPKAAAGFVRGFINADIWGKIAIGAFLTSKLVGFGTIFKALAGKAASGFGSIFSSTVAEGSAAGTRLAAAASAEQAPAFAAAGREAGLAWGAGFRTTSTTTPISAGRRGAATKATTVAEEGAVAGGAVTGVAAGSGRLVGAMRVLGKTVGITLAAVIATEVATDLSKQGRPLGQKLLDSVGDTMGPLPEKAIAKLLPRHLDIRKGIIGKRVAEAGDAIGKLFGGGEGAADKVRKATADAFRDQARAVTETRSALTGLVAAERELPQRASAVAAAEKRVTELRKAGKTDTHAYAVALRNLDDAEAARLQTQARVTTERSRAAQAAHSDVSAAQAALNAARKQTDDYQVLAPLIQNAAKARVREAAATTNASRALRGLTPLTGAAATKMGALVKQLSGFKNFPAFKKFLVTADLSSVNAAVRTVTKLQDLGRAKTALKIIAESKTPEEALKRLRSLLHDLEARRHRIAVEARDEATRRLQALQRLINRIPQDKKLTFRVSTDLTREAAKVLNFAGQGPAAKQLIITQRGSTGARAKGGTVKRDEAMTLVGEEGPEIVKLPVGSRVYPHGESKQMAKRMGIQAFARGGTVKPDKKRIKPEDAKATRTKAREIWEVARQFYPGASERMPTLRFPKHLPKGDAAFVDDATNRVSLGKGAAKELRKGADYYENIILHEWAHVFQKRAALKKWEIEGGAEAFARDIAPKVYKQLNLPYSNRGTAAPGYGGFLAKVRQEHDEDWVLHGQFASKPPVISRKAKAVGDTVHPVRDEVKASGALSGPFGSGEGFIPATKLARSMGLKPTAGRTNHNRLTDSGNVSDHSWGGAVDYSNGVLTSQEDRFADFWKRHLAPVKQLIWRNRIQAGSGKGATVPGHEDHVHLALLRQYALNADATQKVIDGTSGVGDADRPNKPVRFHHLSLGQYVTAAKQVGFPDPALAAAIFYAESKGNVNAVGDKGTSFGAAQIHWPDHQQYNKRKLEEDIFYNFRAAKAISGGGKNFKPWTQFKNGAYKQFLGGRATPLPRGNAGTAQGSSLADYLALNLDEAEQTPGQKDDLKWINRGLRYWRGVFRRNKRAGNFARAQDAFSQITDLRSKKKALRDKPDEDAFTLGDLTYIGKDAVVPPGKRFPGSGAPPGKDYTWDAANARWTKQAVFSQRRVNIGGIQTTLDWINLDIAKAGLTETYDANGNVTAASYADDIAAATEFVNVWTGVKQLAFGETTGLTHGTIKQQTEAATNLKSAKDALKSVQDEAKSEDVSPQDALDAGVSAAEDIKNFLASFVELQKEFGANFKPLPSFAKGGVSRLPLALVGEEGPELVSLPVGSRVHAHPESKRMAQSLGIQPFAKGGVVQTIRSDAVPPSDALRQAIERLEVALKDQPPQVTKNIDARSYFKEVPADPHGYSRAVKFELEAAI